MGSWGGALGAPGKLERSAYIPGRPNPLTACDRNKERRSPSEKEDAWSGRVPHSLVCAIFLSTCVPGPLQELRGLDEQETSLEEFTFYLGRRDAETRQ